MNPKIAALNAAVQAAELKLNNDLNAKPLDLPTLLADVDAVTAAINALRDALNAPETPLPFPANVVAAYNAASPLGAKLTADMAALSFDGPTTETDVAALIGALQSMQTALANPSTP